MPAFRPSDWFKASSVGDAVSVLGEMGERAMVVAGGTMVYELVMRRLIPEVDVLVDIAELNLGYVREEADSYRIGAMTTLTGLLDQAFVSLHPYMGLGEALKRITPVQVRNVATVGGEVCGSVPFFDLPPALIALDAKVTIEGPDGKRTVPVQGFHQDYLLTRLRKGEFVTEVVVPKATSRTGSAFLKLGRSAFDFALLNVGARVSLDSADAFRDVRVVLGGVSKTPFRIDKVEKRLVGRRATLDVVEDASEEVANMKMVGSIHGSGEYKQAVGRVLVRDALWAAVERARN